MPEIWVSFIFTVLVFHATTLTFQNSEPLYLDKSHWLQYYHCHQRDRSNHRDLLISLFILSRKLYWMPSESIKKLMHNIASPVNSFFSLYHCIFLKKKKLITTLYIIYSFVYYSYLTYLNIRSRQRNFALFTNVCLVLRTEPTT